MDDKRLISEERGRNVAEENGIKFFETSAKDNINIEQAFITVSSDRNFLGLLKLIYTTFLSRGLR